MAAVSERALKGGLAVPRIPPAPCDSEPDLLMAFPTLRDQKWKQAQPMCTRNLARPGGRPRSNLTVEVVCCGFGHIAQKIRNFRNSAMPVGNGVPHNGSFMEPWPTVGTEVLV